MIRPEVVSSAAAAPRLVMGLGQLCGRSVLGVPLNIFL